MAVQGFASGRPEADPAFVGRMEKCPAHSDDDMTLCALTGGMEGGEPPLSAAIREFEEESGIQADPGKFIYLGTTRPSKAMDTVVYLFGVDATGKEMGTAQGDGSSGEAGTYCHWVTADDLIKCKDPLTHTMLLRLSRCCHLEI